MESRFVSVIYATAWDSQQSQLPYQVRQVSQTFYERGATVLARTPASDNSGGRGWAIPPTRALLVRDA
jgi:hypothetical protein